MAHRIRELKIKKQVEMRLREEVSPRRENFKIKVGKKAMKLVEY